MTPTETLFLDPAVFNPSLWLVVLAVEILLIAVFVEIFRQVRATESEFERQKPEWTAMLQESAREVKTLRQETLLLRFKAQEVLSPAFCRNLILKFILKKIF